MLSPFSASVWCSGKNRFRLPLMLVHFEGLVEGFPQQRCEASLNIFNQRVKSCSLETIAEMVFATASSPRSLASFSLKLSGVCVSLSGRPGCRRTGAFVKWQFLFRTKLDRRRSCVRVSLFLLGSLFLRSRLCRPGQVCGMWFRYDRVSFLAAEV